MTCRHPLASMLLVLLLSLAGMAVAADGEVWWAYRDAYRALVRFEKQAQPRPGIQQHLQVQALAPGLATEGLRLSLAGPHTALELPLDGALQAQVPLLKAAFDDNAVLRLNRNREQFTFRVRLSLVPRADGQYPLAELRQACEHALAVQAQWDSGLRRGSRCVGVTLAYPRGAQPTVTLRQGVTAPPLQVAPGPLYPGDAPREHAVVTVRWEGLSDAAVLQVPLVPLVIAPLFE